MLNFWILRALKNVRERRLNNFKGGRGVKVTPSQARHSRQSTLFEKDAFAAAYLRAAQAYMLISMPTGTSTIFGAFQAILALHFNPDGFRPGY